MRLIYIFLILKIVSLKLIFLSNKSFFLNSGGGVILGMGQFYHENEYHFVVVTLNYFMKF